MLEQTGETTTRDGRVIPLYGERRRLVTIEAYAHESNPTDELIKATIREQLAGLSIPLTDVSVAIEPIEVISPKEAT